MKHIMRSQRYAEKKYRYKSRGLDKGGNNQKIRRVIKG